MRYRVLDVFDAGFNRVFGPRKQVDDPPDRRYNADDRKDKNDGDCPGGIASKIHEKVFHRFLLQTLARGTLRARPGFNAAMADSSFDSVALSGGIAGLGPCDETIFPGQSTVGVTLSAINALRPFGISLPDPSISARRAAGRPVSDAASPLALRATIP